MEREVGRPPAAPHGWRAIRDAMLVAAILTIAILFVGTRGEESDEAAAWLAMWVGFPASYGTERIPGITFIGYWAGFVALTTMLNGLVIGVVTACLSYAFTWRSRSTRLALALVWAVSLWAGLLWIRSM